MLIKELMAILRQFDPEKEANVFVIVNKIPSDETSGHVESIIDVSNYSGHAQINVEIKVN